MGWPRHSLSRMKLVMCKYTIDNNRVVFAFHIIFLLVFTSGIIRAHCICHKRDILHSKEEYFKWISGSTCHTMTIPSARIFWIVRVCTTWCPACWTIIPFLGNGPNVPDTMSPNFSSESIISRQTTRLWTTRRSTLERDHHKLTHDRDLIRYHNMLRDGRLCLCRVNLPSFCIACSRDLQIIVDCFSKLVRANDNV